jgi:hypothetical protein
LFAMSHLRSIYKSEFTASSRSLKHFPAAVIFVSSANSRGFVLLRHAGRSLI